jgi:hypothetical protein
MRRFVLGWKRLGHATRLDACIVNYADDLVICCRNTAHKAMEAMRDMMGRLKLTVNETKTRVCTVPDETFDFLGYTFGRCYSWKDGKPRIGTKPSKKRVAKVLRDISEMTGRRHVQMEAEEMVGRLNRVLVGWANYFCRGFVSRAYQKVDRHARYRLRQWLRAKHSQRRIDYKKYSDAYVDKGLGLVRLTGLRRSVLWANA